MPLFTTLGLKDKLLCNKGKVFTRLSLFFLATLSFFSLEASPLKIAIFDTGFCPKLLESGVHKIENVTIIPDKTQYSCHQINKKDRRYHGHFVIKQFLNSLKIKSPLEIHPFVIFDNHGRQKYKFWEKAFAESSKRKIDVILAAAGLPLKQKLKTYTTPKQVIFLASGRKGVGIKEDTMLYPQFLFQYSNIYLIGSYYPPLFKNDYMEDQNLLYQNHIDFLFSGGGRNHILRGASRAVATGLALAINLCPLNYFKDHLKLKNCLENKKKTLTFDDSKKTFNTLIQAD